MKRPAGIYLRNKAGKNGAALVIVLAFVVLLTALVVAFFSRAVTERQVSNSSAAGAKADMLARSAADLVIADLKQEIVRGSGSSSPATGVVIYTATSNLTMVPQRDTAVAALSGSSAIPNLVRVSATVAPPSPAVTTGTASNVNIMQASSNGRSMSPAKWNSHYFIPRASTSTTIDSTPIGSATSAGVLPSWVLVTNQGPAVLTTPTNSVIGRYAYAIYDEGGLLDINVAGYPSSTGTAQAAYKSSLAYADLQALPYPIPNPGGGATYQVDNIVGWRNYATIQPSGQSLNGNYDFHNLPLTGTNYYNYLMSNKTGFLSVTGSTYGNPPRTDQLFTSRQDLLRFRRSTAFTQNALQYLTHFSRDLNQPSLVPEHIQNAGAPTVVVQNNGGNDAGPTAAGQQGGDDLINPSFLSVRVTAAFDRNDRDPADPNGSGYIKALIGEPLVKTRFALNRLAWLTFKGPIASDPAGGQGLGTLSADPDLQPVIASLRQRGLSDDFLRRGGPTNIQKYFGLKWNDPSDPNAWLYADSSIKTLSQVASANRDANFVELLKAAIKVGSIAKPSTIQKPTGNPLDPLDWQSRQDYSVDRAILQIAANIIDQSDVDGYPTRILFQGDPKNKEIAGIENLPYLYRMRDGVLKLRNPNPLPPPDPFGDAANGTPVFGTLKDTGVAALMLMPEIWNPHSQTSSLGTPRPQDFRVILDSADPDAIVAGGPGSASTYNTIKVSSWKNTAQIHSYTLNRPPPFTRGPDGTGASFTGGFAGNPRQFSDANSVLTFSVPDANVFREPTLLFKPGKPAGSVLAIDFTGIQQHESSFYADLSPFLGSNGLRSIDTNPAREPTTPPSIQEYIGFCLGVLPLRWTGPSNAIITAKWAELNSPSPAAFFTYRIQFKDANGGWQDYDKKYTDFPGGDQLEIPYSGVSSPSGWPSSGGLVQPYAYYQGYTDPRSSRFGSVRGSWKKIGGYGESGSSSSDWLDATNSYLVSERPDMNAGFSPNWDPAGLPAWEGFKAAGWMNSASFRRGMFSQNLVSLNGTAVTDDGKKYAGDSATNAGGGEYYADADMVVRRAMGGYVAPGSGVSASTTVGLPMVKTLGTGASATQKDSRPIVLNRPFQSVAELGYVFSGTPWKNLDFFAPESGFAGLLDVFCLTETANTGGLMAGRVNLNTRQAPVLQAILAGAYKDEFSLGSSLTTTLSGTLAQTLVSRTTSTMSGKGPLMNVSELVGRYVNSSGSPINGDASYDGFSKDLSNIVGTAGSNPDVNMNNIERFREAVVRPLAASGQTRVWNLMIDVVSQAGRYPQGATTLDKFVVEGEQRYWVHVAIDRFTGTIIDRQIEIVKE